MAINEDSIQLIIEKLSVSNDMNRYITRKLVETHFPTASIPPSYDCSPIQAQMTFYYKDGNLYYKRDGFRCKKDELACWIGNGKKYPRKLVYLNGQNHSQARMIWLLHNGKMPNRVTWKNGNKLDDRIENLTETKGSSIKERQLNSLLNKFSEQINRFTASATNSHHSFHA